MKRVVAVLLGGAMATACASSQVTPTYSGGEVDLVSTGSAQLHQNMRKLWSDHVVWTRQYIVAAVNDDPSAAAAATRLMRNQEEIGNAIAAYYGTTAGNQLTDLLKQHITLATELVKAAKAGDNAAVTDADRRWHDNAADIARFLSTANPTNWPEANVRAMLNDHLALTTQEALARIQKRWADDVNTFDRVYTQAMHMADVLSDGIVAQYPAKV